LSWRHLLRASYGNDDVNGGLARVRPHRWRPLGVSRDGQMLEDKGSSFSSWPLPAREAK
jgi:hypothetical protein